MNLRLVRVVLAVGLLLAGCRDRDDLAGDVAEVTYGDRRAELTVASCGLDADRGVFVLAASSADLFLQLLLAVDRGDDDLEVDRQGSGLTLEVARTGVLGAGDPELLDVPAGAPGTIESATIRGDRVDLVAEARALPSSIADGVVDARVEVAARCPEADDLASRRSRVAGSTGL